MTEKNRPLLLLDVNGLLIYKVRPGDSKKADMKLEKYSVIFRPYFKEFLNEIFKLYDVGIFSSTTWKNISKILGYTFTENQEKNLVCIWCRDRTRLDREKGGYQTLKMLNDIWDNPVINAGNQYNNFNTLLCDDSTIKTRFNDPRNILIVKEYQGDMQDRYLLDILKLIKEKFERMTLEIKKDVDAAIEKFEKLNVNDLPELTTLNVVYPDTSKYAKSNLTERALFDLPPQIRTKIDEAIFFTEK